MPPARLLDLSEALRNQLCERAPKQKPRKNAEKPAPPQRENPRKSAEPEQKKKKSLKRAEKYFALAKKRKDKAAMAFWQERMARAKEGKATKQAADPNAELAKAAKKVRKTQEKEAPSVFAAFRSALDKVAKGEPAPEKPQKPTLKDKQQGKARKAADSLKGADGTTKKFVEDATFRKEVGSKIAHAIVKGAASTVLGALNKIKEVVSAGAALAKAASGKKLDKNDKDAIVQGAKAIAVTAAGMLVIGGLSPFAIGSLAQYFAAETALRSIGHAALMSDTNDDVEPTTNVWARHVLNHVMARFATLDEMDPDELADVIRPSIGAEFSDETETDEATDQEPEGQTARE